MERIAVALQGRVAPIGRERVLEQVIRADAHKFQLANVGIGYEDRRWNLEHHAEIGRADRPTFADEFRTRPIGETSERRDVARIRDHRRHDLHGALDRGAVTRAQLGHEDVGLAIGQAERANPQEWVVLSRERDIGDRFVASDIEQTNRHGARRECRDSATVCVGLLILGGRTRSLEKEKLGSEQAATTMDGSTSRMPAAGSPASSRAIRSPTSVTSEARAARSSSPSPRSRSATADAAAAMAPMPSACPSRMPVAAASRSSGSRAIIACARKIFASSAWPARTTSSARRSDATATASAAAATRATSASASAGLPLERTGLLRSNLTQGP